MEPSNIIFTSNVYPATGIIYNDKQFISKIFDYTKLKNLKNKYFDYASSMLTPLQERMVKEGAICSFAKKDPCWGLAKVNSEMTWVCKCINIDCSYFLKCRPDFDDDEYNLFSPELNDNTSIYRYEIMGQDEIYYPVIYGSEQNDEFSTANKTVEKRDLSLSIVQENKKQKIEVLSVEEPVEDAPTEIMTLTADDEESFAEKELVPEVEVERSCVEMPNNIFEQFITTQQEDIIQAPASVNVIVDAGPGTGKTYTLIEKINYLVSELEIEPEAIQVLSFTNSAVTEIKNRLAALVQTGGDRGLRNVDIRTFHSLSWFLIVYGNENYTDKGWMSVDLGSNMDYEESILHAANLINQFPEIVSGWTHFIVDEVQDLTGNKAKFVLAIINACMKNGCGFSVLGDSCQAIYDYVKNRDVNVITSEEFYKMLYKEVVGNGKFARLEKNHRQTDSLIKLTSDLRNAILRCSIEEIACAVADLHSKVGKLPKPALLLEDSDIYRLSKDGSVCFLCRNNGQTLSMSTILRKRQINHVLNAYETVENFAPWIAMIFYDYPESTISYEQFLELSSQKGIVFETLGTNGVWKKIQKVMKSKSEIIEVFEFLEALRTSKVNDPIFRVVPNNQIVVSTIHKAKGREYDKVILDDSFIRNLNSSQEDIGEFKTLYVAVTRPKRELNTCNMASDRVYSKIQGDTKRWYTQKYHKKLHMEVGLDKDVSKIIFIKGDDFHKRQNYIIQQVGQGDTIKLKRQITDNKISYLILHCINEAETVIGRMSSSFIRDLKDLIKPKYAIDYPIYIEDLFVESVYSHIEDKKFGASFPEIKEISKHCVWSWVSFRGLGHLIYDTY